MSRDERVLVCGGTRVDRYLRPVGEPCGRRYRGWGLIVVEDELWDQARAAGWLVIRIDAGLAVTCPRCRRRDPQLVRDCDQLAASVSTPAGVETRPSPEDGDR